VINGFGPAADIEKERSGIEKEFGVKAIYSSADMTKPAEIAAMIKTAEDAARLVRHPGEQRRHPARRADRGVPAGEVGQIIAINLSSAFHAIGAAVPGMKARKWAASSRPRRRIRLVAYHSRSPTSRPSMASQA